MCMFYRSFFVLFLLAIVLSVLLRYTDSDYPLSILKLVLYNVKIKYAGNELTEILLNIGLL